MADETVPVHIETDAGTRTIQAPRGAVLRDVLLDAGYSPYTRLTRRANCGGRGICATCGVWLIAEADVSDEESVQDDGGDESDDTSEPDEPDNTSDLDVPTNEADTQQPVPAPEHWHDRLADRFGYPRLSCQITVDRPLTVRIPDKRIWGSRRG